MEAEIGLSLPVVLSHLSPGLAVINRPPARIDVRLSGPRILLLKVIPQLERGEDTDDRD